MRRPLTLNLGTTYKDKQYHLLASASGTAPGTVFEKVQVPLSADALFNLTKTAPNGAVLPDTKAKVDALGRAQAGFVAAPQLLAPFSGHRIHWSGVVFAKPKFALATAYFDVLP
jgi:hypothetical protein